MSTVRFCPFCRESYENREACPEHALRLVDFMALPPASATDSLGDRRLAIWHLAHGRGLLLLASVLMLIGFALPLASMHGAVVAESTLWQLAQGRAKTLWLVPIAACGLVAMFARGRTIGTLRSGRLVVAWLGLLPAAVTGLRLFGAYQAAALLSSKTGQSVRVGIGSGAWLVCLGTLVALSAAFALGRSRRRAVHVEQIAERPRS